MIFGVERGDLIKILEFEIRMYLMKELKGFEGILRGKMKYKIKFYIETVLEYSG